MVLKLKVTVILAGVIFLFSGCTKVEGKGGAASIEGKVLVQDYSSVGTVNGTPQPAMDTKVYIIYGNGTTYDDNTSTSYDGSYRFANLRKGTYKVFVYSNIYPVPAVPPNQEAKIEVVTISDKKGLVTVPTININH